MTAQSRLLARVDFDRLIQTLAAQGYRVMGPRERAGAIMFDEIARAEDLPVGLVSAQQPGSYRLEDSGNGRFFDYVHGPESLKRLLFAPEERLWTVSAEGMVSFKETLPEARPVAVIGARACDIAGMQVQDRTFLAGSHNPYADPYYQTRRENLFIVAVNCTRSATTCFCASMDTGPRARGGYDLALTELEDDFLLESGSAAGAVVLAALSLRSAEAGDEASAAQAIEVAAVSQTRRMDSTDIQALLFDNLEHPRWDDVAERCLSCGNCTMVCPTCFCHRETDVTSLDGAVSEHRRQWDSCFALDHSYLHGAQIRPQIRQRYRQWLTHKLASWIEQFGTSGCVGCGRCITWCPTGIDLIEEVNAIRATPGAQKATDI
ncbi:MAG: 4Fe-4S dicluster domain-containing protein [Gammaproteobacteria bacterium]|nr:4Fe-4S dicluster domain-containing protein [Gammaproteobacteria bacterium]